MFDQVAIYIFETLTVIGILFIVFGVPILDKILKK